MQVDGRSSAPWDRVVPLFRSAPHAPQPFARELGTLLPHVPATLKWLTAFAFWTITLHAGLRFIGDPDIARVRIAGSQISNAIEGRKLNALTVVASCSWRAVTPHWTHCWGLHRLALLTRLASAVTPCENQEKPEKRVKYWIELCQECAIFIIYTMNPIVYRFKYRKTHTGQASLVERWRLA